MRLADLKTQALRYLALEEPEKALLIYRAILQQAPTDLECRMRVADVLAQIGKPHLACRVYAAVAWCDLQAGRPLHALVCSQALADLNQSVSSIHDSLAELYGAGSLRLVRPLLGRDEGDDEDGADAPEHQDPDHEDQPAAHQSGPTDGGFVYGNHHLYAPWEAPSFRPSPELEIPEANMLGAASSVDGAAESAAEVAADVRTFSLFPPAFAPIPLFSAFRGAAFVSLSQAARIRRVGPKELLVKEGTLGGNVLLMASGAAQVFRERGGQRRVLLELREGAMLGDLGLCGGRAAPVSVETTEPSDLVELAPRSVRAAGAADPSLALERALQGYVRERLLGLYLLTSPLMRTLTPAQRHTLLRRFHVHRVEADQVLLREGDRMEGMCLVQEGEIEVTRGQEPFEEVLERLQAGWACGEHALLRPLSAPWTLRSITATTVLFLPRDAFERVCANSTETRAYLFGLPAALLRELSGPGRDLLPRGGAPLRLHPDEPEDAEEDAVLRGGDGDDTLPRPLFNL